MWDLYLTELSFLILKSETEHKVITGNWNQDNSPINSSWNYRKFWNGYGFLKAELDAISYLWKTFYQWRIQMATLNNYDVLSGLGG